MHVVEDVEVSEPLQLTLLDISVPHRGLICDH
jgi:hypothetical protein